jgi:hypothetical protein
MDMCDERGPPGLRAQKKEGKTHLDGTIISEDFIAPTANRPDAFHSLQPRQKRIQRVSASVAKTGNCNGLSGECSEWVQRAAAHCNAVVADEESVDARGSTRGLDKLVWRCENVSGIIHLRDVAARSRHRCK